MSAHARVPAIEAGAMGGQPQPDLVAEYITRVIAEAPPLSQQQRDRLAILLRDRRVTS